MKKIKILFACLLAISIGLGVSAFKQQQHKASQATTVYDSHWYKFIGDPTNLDQVKDASYYEYSAGTPTCEANAYICAVFAPGPAGEDEQPTSFSDPLKAALEYSAVQHSPTSNILMED